MRGPNKQTPWSRSRDAGDEHVSVLRLALDTRDPAQRARLEAMFSAAFSLRRAVQHDARNRSRAYGAASHERERDAAATRDRLGLSRTALEHAAYAHLDAAPHLRRFVTKALAMHLADSVWTATERHLFRDARGKRHGLPRIGGFYDFTRLPARARTRPSASGRRSGCTAPSPVTALRTRTVTATSCSPDACARSTATPGGATRVRLRSCSAGLPAARSCCRCGCRRRRRTSRSSTITSPTRARGTRSIWCGRARRRHPVAGATKRI